MKKIVIAGMLATVLAGSGLIALLQSNETAAAQTATNASPATSATPQASKQKQKPQQDGKCRPEASAPRGKNSANSTSETVQGDYTVLISGGFDTDPADHGRPVVLIAAALGVPTEVFREAFSGVTPAGLDRGPTAEEAQSNKAALMKVLAPYGITNDRLDEVSNYYRYNGKNGGVWKRTLATAIPIVKDGVVTGVTVTDPGSGYSSAPTVTIKGPNGAVTATATVAFGKDFATNGSLSSLTLD
ncbi:hypothetical protein [Cohnella sp. GCM10027633]|uniref:hypothetical protein n=1 Tax=unclassified Cohnella TaxID=2636738 RepID=UPI003641F2D0